MNRTDRPKVAISSDALHKVATRWALADAGMGLYALPCAPRRGHVQWDAAALDNTGCILPPRLTSQPFQATPGKPWSIRRWFHRDDLKAALRGLRGAMRTGETTGRHLCRAIGEETWCWLEFNFQVVSSSATHVLLLRVTDISEAHYARIDIDLTTDRLRMALQSAQMGMFGDAIGLRRSFSSEGSRPGWQLNAAALYGLPVDRPTNLQDLADRLHPEDQQGVFDSYRQMLEHVGTVSQHEYRVIWPDGTQRWLLARAVARMDPASGQPFSTGVVMDITERKLVEQRITHIANHDSLTGLPTRALFRECLQLALARVQAGMDSFAVMFVDLDRFKVINDTLGHAAGDSLLQTLAGRFTAAVRPDDVVARLGGDEFVVLASGVESSEHAALLASKLLEAARQPVVLAGHECQVGASIGVCLAPEHGTDAQLLLQRADVAMYQAKEQGRNRFRIFDAQSPEAERRLQIELQLTKALERGEFHLVYQPQVDPITLEIRGVEALLRWDNSSLGSIAPDQFIPVAEETGQIVAIGEWVMLEACRQAQRWALEGAPPFRVAVNVSPRQLRDPGFRDLIQRTLKATGLAPDRLEIEITEGAVIGDPEAAIHTLKAIRALSVSVALDDFGMGYSSLSQLRSLPLDVLKIDRSFVHDVASNDGAKAITCAVAAMGRALGLRVVAEGIETEQEAQYLREHVACDVFQGYLYGRPTLAAGLVLGGQTQPAMADLEADSNA